MNRFAGIKNGYIHVISDKLFTIDGLKIIEIPESLNNIPDVEFILNYRFHNGILYSKDIKKSVKDLKVALVGNWKMQCGIATYSENLWQELIKYVGDFKLFIEKNEFPTGNIYQIGDQILPEDKVSVCWKRGESPQNLIKDIKDYNPDIVLIAHEFGLWNNSRYWLSLMTQLSDYRVIVIMHSVFPNHQDKIVYESAMPEIVVHLAGAQHNLQYEKGINAKVHLIPHGCYPIVNQTKLWDNYKSKHTVIQQGFLFRYKGWEIALRAIAILKQKYPDIFFTGLCSESPYAKMEHQLYYNELMTLAEKLDITANVAMIRGFQTDLVLDTFYRSNTAAIFPYVSSPEHEVFGASGAARLAMSKGLPVISSSINHFSDLDTIKANTAEEIAAQLELLFDNEALRKFQIEKQNNFIIQNSWENVAKQFIKIFED